MCSPSVSVSRHVWATRRRTTPRGSGQFRFARLADQGLQVAVLELNLVVLRPKDGFSSHGAIVQVPCEVKDMPQIELAPEPRPVPST